MKTKEPEMPCCPEFDPAPWDEKKIEWHGKLFIRRASPQFLHFPLPGYPGITIRKLWAEAEAAGAAPDMKDFLMLSYDCSPWLAHYYLAVKHSVPNADDHAIAGVFYTKVFDGPYRKIPQWIKEMNSFVDSRGQTVIKYYFYYTTCPKCARKYGHNYVVLFAQVS